MNEDSKLPSQRSIKGNLVLAAFLGLFVELALIRWLPGNVLSLTYFSNIVLISSFLGLGLGFLSLKEGRDLFKYFPIAFVCLLGLSVLFRYIDPIIPNLENELIWSIYSDNASKLPRMKLGIVPVLAMMFFFNAGFFVLIGQKIAGLMQKLKPLEAYTFDIIGSILGIVSFTVLSFIGGFWSTPVVWFAIAGIASLVLIIEHRKHFFVGVVCVALTTFGVWYVSQDDIWSPYYRITQKVNSSSNFIYVNQFFFQQMLDFDSNVNAREKYSIPYKLRNPESVLILGAGSGNDVAIASGYSASQIDAVEIDREILDIGKKFHPNKPYQNPNVSIYIDDARSFLKKSTNKYEMIVVGTLDSHALLSTKSTVRLDNFVYTKESLQEMKNRLTDDGVAVFMFSAPVKWLSDKIVKSVQDVYGTSTIAMTLDPQLFNLMVIAGPGIETIIKDYPNFAQFQSIPKNIFDSENISTDDWPYLYLRTHSISSYYLLAIALLLLISCSALFLLFRKNSKVVFQWSSFTFFCLGVGFLLLETVSITRLSLLFGSTWVVNSFVFTGILLMVLLANIIVSRVKIVRIEWVYAGLALTLVANYLLPLSSFLGNNFWVQSLVPAFIATLPIFFASTIFSYNFRSVKDVALLYGVNLMGAVFGGFLEYGSMITGLKFLYIVALIIYLASYFAYRKASLANPN